VSYDELSHPWTVASGIYLGNPGWLGGLLVVPIAWNIGAGVAIDQVNPARHIAEPLLPCVSSAVSQDTKTWRKTTQRLIEAAREPKELGWFPGSWSSRFVRTGVRTQSAEFLRKIH